MAAVQRSSLRSFFGKARWGAVGDRIDFSLALAEWGKLRAIRSADRSNDRLIEEKIGQPGRKDQIWRRVERILVEHGAAVASHWQ